MMDPIIYWLGQVGCEATHTEMFQVEICAGTPMHEHFVRQLCAFGHQIRPFLLQTDVITVMDFEALFAQIQREVRERHFCGICPQYLFCFKRTHRPPHL